MYERMKKAKEWLDAFFNWVIVAILIIVFFILGSIAIDTTNWLDGFSYPKEELQSLTEEANRIIETKDFNSEYKLTTTETTYPDKTIKLKIYLVGDSSSVTAIVENWETPKQSKPDIELSPRNNIVNCISNFFLILAPTVLISGVIVVIGLIIFGLLYIISFVIYKFKESSKSKKPSA